MKIPVANALDTSRYIIASRKKLFRRAVRSTARNGIRLCRGGSPFSVGSGCRIGPDRAKSEACDAKRALFLLASPRHSKCRLMNDSASLPHSSSPASVSSVPADDPRRHGAATGPHQRVFVNVLVLLGSLLVVIVSLSLEVFHRCGRELLPALHARASFSGLHRVSGRFLSTVFS